MILFNVLYHPVISIMLFLKILLKNDKIEDNFENFPIKSIINKIFINELTKNDT